MRQLLKNDWFHFTLNEPKDVNIYLSNAGLDSEDGVRLYLYDKENVNHGEFHGNNETGVLSVNLKAMSWDVIPFPAGDWYIQVTNSFGEIQNSGDGSAPLCFKRPYRIIVILNLINIICDFLKLTASSHECRPFLGAALFSVGSFSRR
jgi:hypothetical protein